VAFSWPEPQFSGTVTPLLIEAGKFAWLEGDVSEPSNASGIATFKDLTVNYFFLILKKRNKFYFVIKNRLKDQIRNMFIFILYVME